MSTIEELLYTIGRSNSGTNNRDDFPCNEKKNGYYSEGNSEKSPLRLKFSQWPKLQHSCHFIRGCMVYYSFEDTPAAVMFRSNLSVFTPYKPSCISPAFLC